MRCRTDFSFLHCARYATCALCFVVFTASINADESDYSDIETLEVVGKTVVRGASATGTVNTVALDLAPLTPAAILPDVLAFVPSANIRTNSRGETLVSIRGSGERQFAVYFDGAAVNVPWDNRIDLGLIPVAGISHINVAAGPAAIEYGANSAGGVVEIIPVSDAHKSFDAEIGSGGMRRLAAALVTGERRTGFSIAAGHLERDGLIAERSTRSDFAAPGGVLITNTDRRQTNFLARLTHETQAGSGISASVLFNDAHYGIAPEQGPGFTEDDARYWRFPVSTYSLTTLNGRISLGQQLFADLSVWYQTFDQDIQAFTDSSYSTIERVQQDRNDTVGTRAILSRETQQGSVSVYGAALWSTHDEVQSGQDLTGVDADTFTQQTLSFGGSYTRFLSTSVSATLGGSYEIFEPGQTAGRGNTGRFSGANAVAEINVEASDAWRFRASAGRRVRLPTMRELFGEAIGRFALNPDLAPEKTWQFELEARFKTGQTNFGIIPFASLTNDTLDQQRILVAGSRLRQRINLRGSRTYGIEFQGETTVSDRLTVEGNATWNTHTVLRESVDNSSRRLYLSDRPNWLARLNAAYQLGSATTLGVNVVHRGEAQSQDGSGVFRSVEPSTQVNIAITHTFYDASVGNGVSLYIRADNVTDAFIEPQLGLPDAGRSIWFGLTARL